MSMVLRARKFDGKKYMWDGCEYSGPEQARTAAEAYRKDGFETEPTLEQDRHVVYTRRVVKETVVEGQPR